MKNKNGIPIAYNFKSNGSSVRYNEPKPYWVPFDNLAMKYAELQLDDGENVVSVIMPYVEAKINEYLAKGWVLKSSWNA